MVGRSFGDINLQLLGIYDGSNKVLNVEKGSLEACLLFIMQGIFLPFQVDQEAVEEFNLTSDGEFRAVKTLVLGRVDGKRSRERVHVL